MIFESTSWQPIALQRVGHLATISAYQIISIIFQGTPFSKPISIERTTHDNQNVSTFQTFWCVMNLEKRTFSKCELQCI